MRPESERTGDTFPGPRVDDSNDVLRRAPGCLTAFVLFALGGGALEVTPFPVPRLALYVGSTCLGALLVHVYARTARDRWGVDTPDVVQMLGEDLTNMLGSGTDFRISFPKRQPWRDRLLHEGLYVLKWTGHLLIFTGVGLAIYTIVSGLGWVE